LAHLAHETSQPRPTLAAPDLAPSAAAAPALHLLSLASIFLPSLLFCVPSSHPATRRPQDRARTRRADPPERARPRPQPPCPRMEDADHASSASSRSPCPYTPSTLQHLRDPASPMPTTSRTEVPPATEPKSDAQAATPSDLLASVSPALSFNASIRRPDIKGASMPPLPPPLMRMP
jgi:hypothetical protein